MHDPQRRLARPNSPSPGATVDVRPCALHPAERVGREQPGPWHGRRQSPATDTHNRQRRGTEDTGSVRSHARTPSGPHRRYATANGTAAAPTDSASASDVDICRVSRHAERDGVRRRLCAHRTQRDVCGQLPMRPCRPQGIVKNSVIRTVSMSMQRFVIALAMFTTGALPCQADPITWKFSEHVSQAFGPYEPLQGTDIYGRFSFDSNQSTPDAAGGVYSYVLGQLVLFLPALDSVWTYASGQMNLRLSTDESPCQFASAFPQCMFLEFFDPTSSNPNAPPPPGEMLGAGPNARTLGFEMNILVPGFPTGALPLTPPPDARVVGGFWNSNSCSPICGTSNDLTAVSPVPEPATLVLLGTGLLAVAARHRRSRQ
jgi:hypothetical protein